MEHQNSLEFSTADSGQTRLTTMKLIILTVLVAVVYAENCQQTSDCQLTVCGANMRLSCYDNTCTCATDYTCTVADDCNVHGECEHNDHQWHCYDNRCRCRFWWG